MLSYHPIFTCFLGFVNTPTAVEYLSSVLFGIIRSILKNKKNCLQYKKKYDSIFVVRLHIACNCELNLISFALAKIWLLGQAVKTSPFHGGNTGSIPVGVIKKVLTNNFLFVIIY